MIKGGSMDLQDTNISYNDPAHMRDGVKVVLVDFDWGGKAWDISYPTASLNQEQYTVHYAAGDLKNRKENDI